MEKLRKKISEMDAGTKDDMLCEIFAALWPEEDPDQQWSPDTLDQIANVFINNGLDYEEET